MSEQIKTFLDYLTSLNKGVIVYQLENIDDEHTMRLIYANPHVERSFGLKMPASIGKYMHEIFPQAEKNGIIHAYAQAIRNQKAVNRGIRFYQDVHINQLWVDVNLIPIDHDQLLVVFDDRTEEILHSQILKEKEERYRLVFDSINDAIIVYRAENAGMDFIIVEFNHRAEKVENIARSKVLGKSVKVIFPGIESFGLFEVFQRVWKTGIPEIYPTHLYSDNRISGWRENEIFRLSTGEIMAIYSDMSSKMEDLAQIESLAKFPSENPNPVIRISIDGKIIYQNISAENLMETSSNDLTEYVPSEWKQYIDRALTTNQVHSTEIQVQKHRPQFCWFRSICRR